VGSLRAAAFVPTRPSHPARRPSSGPDRARSRAARLPVVRIFVTGATGYVGRALVRRLRGEEDEGAGLVRAPSRGEPRAELGVATFPGDLLDRASMREGMSGADWVIHAAADLDSDGPPGRMRAANVQGSENVASLAYKLGVGRFLSVSSIAFFGG